MKFFVSSEQRRFFNEHHYIEFLDLIPPERLKELQRAVKQVISKDSYDNCFLKGRDLWRHSKTIEQFYFQARFADILREFFGNKMLILGADQYLPSRRSAETLSKRYFETTFKEPLNIDQLTSIQGSRGAFLVGLEGGHSLSPSPFPSCTGQVTFLAPEALLNLADLDNMQNSNYLLFTYVETTALYVFRECDPNTHLLKQYGYGFGDALKDHGHKIVVR